MYEAAEPNGDRSTECVDAGVACSNEVLRERIAEELSVRGISVSAATVDAQELIASYREGPPSVVVLVSDPMDENAAAELVAVREQLTPARVVVLASSEHHRYARKALRHGADGYLAVETLETTLGPTVRAVAAGQVCLPQGERTSAARQPLSYRERQVIGMVVMGFSNGEIARRLFLAESTIKSHLSSAFGKLGVKSRAEATAVVLDPAEGVGVGILTIPESAIQGKNGHRGRGPVAS